MTMVQRSRGFGGVCPQGSRGRTQAERRAYAVYAGLFYTVRGNTTKNVDKTDARLPMLLTDG
ncbi:hypothetical protein ACFVVQ_15180 [Paenibacillus chitinolyticus]|uniref:hypothetical protein n=1 Tax=Paenibacillus chitinolyticus TaxID=79263 RepID=UPI0036DB5843